VKNPDSSGAGPQPGAGQWGNERHRGMANLPPFPPAYRASGLLLNVTCLPSPYGIGDLGSSAFSPETHGV